MNTDKFVVITGASTGIGRAIAEALDARNYHVFAGVRKQADADALNEQSSARLQPIILDVTDEKQVSAAAGLVGAACGDRGLLGLINNAGIAVPGALEHADEARIRQQLEVNVMGVMRVSQAFLPHLRKFPAERETAARIVNIGSIGGRNAYPYMGLYNMSKFALAGMSEAMRYELHPWRIHVALLEPGAIATPIWEKGDADFDAALAAMSDEARGRYEQTMTRFQKIMRKIAAQGAAPETVVKAALHALESNRPKNRYVIGREAKITAGMVRFLPERLRFNLVAKHLHLRPQVN